jgi:beta-glucosidase/6-phospho-beta-glucosidase/beta-galactosidase
MKLENGRRLDLLESTRHAELARADYERLRSMGMTACRDGLSWAQVESRPGAFDFARAGSMLAAAEQTGVQVIWDLVHFGWPDDVDVFAPSFPGRVARYAKAFARFFRESTDQRAWITPINEISFLSWAGGDVAVLDPWCLARGVELKIQLVRATIEAIEAIRDVLPHARFVQPEPLIQIHPAPEHPKTWRRVESDNLLQFQAWDMLTGKIFPGLGGHPKYLDVIGVNYYPDNQFMLDGTTIARGDPRYRPFRELLAHAHRRYERPIFLSETGTEGDARADWLAYVVEECLAAMREGVELHGITLYPVLDHPGWVDDRHCPNGLWGYADERGARPIHEPLKAMIERETKRLLTQRTETLAKAEGRVEGAVPVVAIAEGSA